MSDQDTRFGARFIRDYSALLNAAWSSADEMNTLLADPTAYATDRGLPVDPGARVEVDRTPLDGLPHKDDIVRAWIERPGVHVLRVPPTAPVDLSELTDAELDAVAAGMSDNNIIIVIV